MEPTRRTSLVAGVFFLITWISAIAGALLYGPVLSDPHYVLGAGTDTAVAAGALCEIVLCITNIGTAVVLFPLLRRQSEGIALGYVAARIMESAIIAVGILSLLSIVTLRQQFARDPGADEGSLVVAGQSLVALHDATFLLGPGFLAGFGNGLLLGYLMYRSGLVPRPMALVGLIGGPICAASGIAVMFGLYEQVSVWSGLATLPEMVWEGFLAIYLTFKGFRPAPITAGMTAAPSTQVGVAR